MLCALSASFMPVSVCSMDLLHPGTTPGNLLMISCTSWGSTVGHRQGDWCAATGGALRDQSDRQKMRCEFPDQALERACGVVTRHLYEFATDRNASHVARRLLCVLAGRDVLPAPGRAANGVDGASHGKAGTSPCALLCNTGRVIFWVC